MRKNLFTLGAILAASTMVTAAPAQLDKSRPPVPPVPQEKPRPPMPKPQQEKPRPPMPKPQHEKLRPPMPKPHEGKPRPPMPRPVPKPPVPPAHPVVEYRQVRNTYTIQLNADNVIIFEQRIIGLRELRDKIRMVKFDRPRPLIIVKVESGVAKSRLDYALKELRTAGFNDVQIVNIPRRVKFAPAPRIPAKRVRR